MKKKKSELVGTSVLGKAFFDERFGTCKNKPFLAVQDSTGRIQCFDAKTKAAAAKEAKKFLDAGFKVLVGVG